MWSKFDAKIYGYQYVLKVWIGIYFILTLNFQEEDESTQAGDDLDELTQVFIKYYTLVET